MNASQNCFDLCFLQTPKNEKEVNYALIKLRLPKITLISVMTCPSELRRFIEFLFFLFFWFIFTTVTAVIITKYTGSADKLGH